MLTLMLLNLPRNRLLVVPLWSTVGQGTELQSALSCLLKLFGRGTGGLGTVFESPLRSPHVSPPVTPPVSTTEGVAGDPVTLTSLSLVVNSLVQKVSSLENALTDTKQTHGKRQRNVNVYGIWLWIDEMVEPDADWDVFLDLARRSPTSGHVTPSMATTSKPLSEEEIEAAKDYSQQERAKCRKHAKAVNNGTQMLHGAAVKAIHVICHIRACPIGPRVEARRDQIKMTKGFNAKESVKGHMVNLSRFEGHIEPIPAPLEGVINHLIKYHFISENRRPNSCIISFFDEGEYSQPFLKPPHLDQPISTLVLSESSYGVRIRI
ncbi:putative oxidoreductase, 2OG-Fe(II) oxygenase family protein [Tanacetum coccineum]|uniref:Oxidoreductase, 2OG-Fe(II) oxygenase family protein n=1 Tax=Tanacetum coccineum TaxID=301880 RepID=A0ABQ4ZFN0_9ASTR